MLLSFNIIIIARTIQPSLYVQLQTRRLIVSQQRKGFVCYMIESKMYLMCTFSLYDNFRTKLYNEMSIISIHSFWLGDYRRLESCFYVKEPFSRSFFKAVDFGKDYIFCLDCKVMFFSDRGFHYGDGISGTPVKTISMCMHMTQ